MFGAFPIVVSLSCPRWVRITVKFIYRCFIVSRNSRLVRRHGRSSVHVRSSTFTFCTPTLVSDIPFLNHSGVGIGMMGAVVINLQVNKKYARDVIANGGSLPPEARLPPACFGGVCLPVGLFWYVLVFVEILASGVIEPFRPSRFAWTVQPSVHFIVPCIATIPFGLGMVLGEWSSLGQRCRFTNFTFSLPELDVCFSRKFQ